MKTKPLVHIRTDKWLLISNEDSAGPRIWFSEETPQSKAYCLSFKRSRYSPGDDDNNYDEDNYETVLKIECRPSVCALHADNDEAE